jgi:putative flippase GtrA
MLAKIKPWVIPSKRKITVAYFLCLIGVFIWPISVCSLIYAFALHKNSQQHTWAESYCTELMKLFVINTLWIIASLIFLLGTTALANHWNSLTLFIIGIIIAGMALVGLWIKTVLNYIKNTKYIYY